jgi:tetratricopeptide (TPR) repeat protein
LLVPAEQLAMANLAVFQGDISRESALTVAGAALPLLAALADKSLLRTTEQGRFAFHPLIRQFALAKLGHRGANQEEAVRTRHAEYFLGLLARYNSFHALDQRAALKAIGEEIENTLAAWGWAIAQRRVDLLQDCASALESYLDARGQQQFGIEQFNLALAAIDESLPAHQLARCHLQLARASFYYRRGEFRDGESAARAALQAAQRARYRFGVKSSTNTLGLMLWRRGRMKEAAFCLRDVLRRARADADHAAVPLYELNLARIQLDLGNDDEGERLLRDALDGSRRTDNLAGLQAALNDLCQLQLDRKRPDAVLPLAQEGLALCETSGFRRNAAYFRRALAEALFALDDLKGSERHARSALEAIQFGGDRTLEPSCRVQLARIELRAGHPAAALSELQTAARLALEMQSPRVKLMVTTAYASWCLQQGRPEEAHTLFSLTMNHPAASRPQRELAAAGLTAIPPASPDIHPTLVAHEIADLDQALNRLLNERL